jgi:ABC-type multidrug transport system fused ATPase/permease subunit
MLLGFADCIISGVIIATGAKYTAVYVPLTLVVLYLIQKFYLRTSRQLRHLDLEAKSPLYTHFTETLSGGITIRAFGWDARFIQENHRRLNASQRPFYLLFCIQQWLSLVLDISVAGIAVMLVSFALLLPEGTTKGAIALSLFTLISFSFELTGLVMLWTTLETSLGAIARLKSFSTRTPKEDKDWERQSVPDGWPTKGAIKFDGVTASYRYM